ncbi:hypothetical protein BDW22DRAFT_746896 [Trametopsis cervina]|nr:hypothetical protein BDW22DRAFT_746896 [Trametopsis cervina]
MVEPNLFPVFKRYLSNSILVPAYITIISVLTYTRPRIDVTCSGGNSNTHSNTSRNNYCSTHHTFARSSMGRSRNRNKGDEGCDEERGPRCMSSLDEPRVAWRNAG